MSVFSLPKIFYGLPLYAASMPKLSTVQQLLHRRHYILFYLTTRFHVAMRQFSNRSQVASKCGKNKEVAHELQASVSLSKTTF